MSEATEPESHCHIGTFLTQITRPTTCPSFIGGLYYTPPTPGWGYFWIILISVYLARLCMGQSPSNIYKKTTNYFRGSEHSPLADVPTNSVVVRQRRSSLQRDEDNDIAHEFYEEIKYHGGRSKMKKVHKTYPLGIVKLNVPCLHPDFVRIIIPNYDIASKFEKQVSGESSGGSPQSTGRSSSQSTARGGSKLS